MNDPYNTARDAILEDLKRRFKAGDKNVSPMAMADTDRWFHPQKNYFVGFGEMACPICKTGKLRYERNAYNGHVCGMCSNENCVRWRELTRIFMPAILKIGYHEFVVKDAATAAKVITAMAGAIAVDSDYVEHKRIYFPSEHVRSELGMEMIQASQLLPAKPSKASVTSRLELEAPRD